MDFQGQQETPNHLASVPFESSVLPKPMPTCIILLLPSMGEARQPTGNLIQPPLSVGAPRDWVSPQLFQAYCCKVEELDPILSGIGLLQVCVESPWVSP